MKRKILGIILVLSFCTGIFMPVRAADNLTPYILGTTVSDSTEQDIWYSMQIESDGAYKVFHRTIGGYIGVYEKTGKTAFGDLGNKTKIVDYGYNNLENAFIEEYAIYLHKGDYLIQHSRSDQFSFKVEKIATPYGEDKEPNETAAEAIPLAINGKAGGVMGGVNENGDIDVSDFYKIEILGSVKCVFNLISDKDYISFDILTSKGEAFYLPQAQGFVTSSAYNDLLKKFELNLEVDFEEAGTYYIRLGNRYYRPYNPYLLTMGDGSGNSAEPEPIIPPPKDKQILEVDIPSEPEGKLTALVTEVGIKFDITPNASEFGYRIYRSTDPAIEGISISDFPLTKGQFVDVNIDPNTRYYYTIRKVIAEAGFDRATIEIIPEVLGEPSQKIALDSGDIIPLPQPPPGYDYTKNFLLMKIGEPNMLFNEETVEIDAGRGTVPVIENGRTLIPIRAIIECMGGNVGWDDATQKVSLTAGELSATEFEVMMIIGERDLTANGEKKTMDVAPQIINERTMLPLRFVAENVGGEIAWVGSTREIIIVFYTKVP